MKLKDDIEEASEPSRVANIVPLLLAPVSAFLGFKGIMSVAEVRSVCGRFIDRVLLKAEEQRRSEITLEQIIEIVCRIYQLSTTKLCAPGKAQPVAEARAVAASLTRNTDSLSLSELAGFLSRDLTGLSQAALQIERRAAADDLWRRKLDRAAEQLRTSVCQT